MRKTQKKSTKTCSHEDFVRAWQTSDSAAEVARKLGIERSAASSRACYMRKRGVPLKLQKRTGGKGHMNICALKQLAKSLEK
jgi:hypothetical protein